MLHRLLSATAITLTLGVSSICAARDSTWLICQGVATQGQEQFHVVANVVEHRDPSGEGRDLEVTLIRGTHMASATAKDPHGDGLGAIKLRVGTFKGTVQWNGDEDAPVVVLAGTYNAKLACTNLDDDAIGH